MSIGIFKGFRVIGAGSKIIEAVLESQTLFNHEESKDSGIIVLTVIEDSMSDHDVLDLAESLPTGQLLWHFSRVSRPIDSPRVFRSTHVPSAGDREFQLKIEAHISRFVKSQLSESRFTSVRRQFPTMEVRFGDHPYFPIFDSRHIVEKFIDGVPFQFFSDLDSKSKKLVIFGQDAITRSKTDLPYFFRWRWAEQINASVLVLNDPTLYLDPSLDGAWWIGSKNRDYVSEFIEIVNVIVETQKIEPSDILFVGMSAGGFSALQMASLLPGARAIVDIPRITLRAIGAKGKTADLAVQRCLGFPSAFKVPDEYLPRIDVLSRISETNCLPNFVYFQNVLDLKHFESQYQYFKSSIQAMSQYDEAKHQFYEYSQWNLTKGGHFPLKESVMVEFINKYLEGDLKVDNRLTAAQITSNF